MSELINGRTPEEIKAALRFCTSGNDKPKCNVECPYFDTKNCYWKLFKDAFVLIERLEAERDAALAKVPKWISMGERFPPPKTERFLVVCRYADGDIVVKTAIWAWAEDEGRGDWICWERVTHWMPLPEPPEEDTHG